MKGFEAYSDFDGNLIMIKRGRFNKFNYYVKAVLREIYPSSFLQRKLKRKLAKLEEFDENYIHERVNYYNKLYKKATLSDDIPQLSEFKRPRKTKTYYFDLMEFARYFPGNIKLKLEPGDVTHIPKIPSFVKSRPIKGDNQNSVLLNLNKIRHFVIVDDLKPFREKKNKLVWLGSVFPHQPLRKRFLETHFHNPLCDLGMVNEILEFPLEWRKDKMSHMEQLSYKFILSLEGNDVATNLKWVMSSNSLAVMPQPKYETWFMEGRLIPDFHYVKIKDDFSDLNEKLAYYAENVEKAEQIIHNAHQYIQQFRIREREALISLMVLDKYFQFTN